MTITHITHFNWLKTFCNDNTHEGLITGAQPYFAEICHKLKSRDIINKVFNTKFQNNWNGRYGRMMFSEIWVHNELLRDITYHNSPLVLNDKEFSIDILFFTELCVSVQCAVWPKYLHCYWTYAKNSSMEKLVYLLPNADYTNIH